jgi:hypothetical protein
MTHYTGDCVRESTSEYFGLQTLNDLAEVHVENDVSNDHISDALSVIIKKTTIQYAGWVKKVPINKIS